MTLAGEAWIIGDGNFRDAKTFNFEQRGQKSVHAFKELEVLDTLAFKRAIIAAGIADFFAGKAVADPVSDAREGNATEIIPLTARFNPGAANAIKLFQGFKEFRQVFRIVLQIGIKGDQV